MDTPDFEEDSASEELDDFIRRVANVPPRRPPPMPQPGDRWGRKRRYRIEGCLGKGGMGAVYLAYDLLLDRPVALKVLHRSSDVDWPADRSRLLREARAAACIEHDRVARVYDVGEHDGVPFVAMELIRGVTLRRWMQNREGDVAEIVAIGVQIAEGLDALHRKGIVHRDLKPENVMLSEGGGIKLLDLGLAKRRFVMDGDGGAELGGDPPSTALRVGTPGYMAPEQYTGANIDARADVFALGIVLYELVTRQRPFEGKSIFDLTRATLSQPPTFSSDRWRTVPYPLRSVIERALAKDPETRLATARGVLDGLTPLLPPPSMKPVSSPLAATIDLEHAPTVAVPSYTFQRPRSLSSWPSRPIRNRVGAALILVLSLPFVLNESPRKQAQETQIWAPGGMVAFPSSTFRMGHDEAELQAECPQLSAPCPMDFLVNEMPAREARVSPFALDVREVTNAQFVVLLWNISPLLQDYDDLDSHQPRFVRFASGTHKGELVLDMWPATTGITYEGQQYKVKPGMIQTPVVLVSWLGANLYCRSQGKRLPTETEWEYAAHGTSSRRFPWGDDPPSCGQVALQQGGMVPVASGSCDSPLTGPVSISTSPQDVTPEGIQNLGGNVAEWTDSRYTDYAHAAANGDRPETSEGSADDAMTVRGGSYHESVLARATSRTKWLRGTVAEDVGFRCALSAPDDTGSAR
jgi:serine/threonine protein kinase